MQDRTISRAVITLLAAVAVALVFVSCGDRSDATSDGPQDVSFEIIPDYLGPAYASPDLGVEFRPPLGWAILDAAQRDRVATALVAQEEEGVYGLHVVDIFLQTETLSFAALSRVTLNGKPVVDRKAYEESVAQSIADEPSTDINETTSFYVGGISVTQYRHVRGDRVTFTLVFDAADGSLVQLDYSIPSPAYKDEGIKLESSIGTLQRIEPEES